MIGHVISVVILHFPKFAKKSRAGSTIAVCNTVYYHHHLLKEDKVSVGKQFHSLDQN